jgi:aryl-alcohol dehydrogenase-like predicted oxidoreductase
VQFPLRWPQVCSVVLGTRTADHARGGAARATVTIPEQLWAELDAEGLVVTVG